MKLLKSLCPLKKNKLRKTKSRKPKSRKSKSRKPKSKKTSLVTSSLQTAPLSAPSMETLSTCQALMETFGKVSKEQLLLEQTQRLNWRWRLLELDTCLLELQRGWRIMKHMHIAKWTVSCLDSMEISATKTWQKSFVWGSRMIKNTKSNSKSTYNPEASKSMSMVQMLGSVSKMSQHWDTENGFWLRVHILERKLKSWKSDENPFYNNTQQFNWKNH